MGMRAGVALVRTALVPLLPLGKSAARPSKMHTARCALTSTHAFNGQRHAVTGVCVLVNAGMHGRMHCGGSFTLGYTPPFGIYAALCTAGILRAGRLQRSMTRRGTWYRPPSRPCSRPTTAQLTSAILSLTIVMSLRPLLKLGSIGIADGISGTWVSACQYR